MARPSAPVSSRDALEGSKPYPRKGPRAPLALRSPHEHRPGAAQAPRGEPGPFASIQAPLLLNLADRDHDFTPVDGFSSSTMHWKRVSDAWQSREQGGGGGVESHLCVLSIA